MFNRKRFICFLLAALMIFSLAACGKGNDTTKTSGTEQVSGQEQKTDAADSKTDDKTEGETSGSKTAEPAKLSGKVNLIELDDRDPSILRGVRIVGNSVGTSEDINGKKSSLTDVRCIFTMNEWVEFYPDTDAEYYLRVWVIKHRDDQEYYNTCKFSDLVPNFATYCDLHYPVDEENPDEYQWGSFCLNPDDCEPGYYDFVFTYEGKAIAVLQTRFYKDGEISGKSDAELEKLMKE